MWWLLASSGVVDHSGTAALCDWLCTYMLRADDYDRVLSSSPLVSYFPPQVGIKVPPPFFCPGKIFGDDIR